MNPDYAHLVPGGRLDFARLGRALTAVAERPDCSFRMIARNAGVDEITIRRAARHQKVSAESYLKICIVLDLNPFDCLVKQEGVSREYTTVAPSKKAG
ncbi:hypothetical protein [Labrenzia sp. DG1229]|uniref:hypothetical protein n=1 Tax=Labrenzia sp. DG1229 TaxID=681847 RepID=UPI00048CE2D2|nr:hypothetical protein [Labrenzia sp. DG1229]